MIALIDYDAGNICSVMNALDRLDVNYVLTDDSRKIMSAEKVIFPGVGHAGAAMANLVDKGLDQVIKHLKQPVLGICVGMQLLCSHSEEGDTPCLNIVPAKVKRFSPDLKLKVPHMGWNEIQASQTNHVLLENVSDNDFVYFVHSYYVEDNPYSIASAHYGLDICAAIQKENFYGIQFHAEKSSAVGEQILSNFIKNI
jgi:glutamine amidotransferase